MQHLRLLGPVMVLGPALVGAIVVGVMALAGAYRGGSRRAAVVRGSLAFLLGFGSALTLTVTLLPAEASAPAHYLSLDVFADLSRQFADFSSPTAITQVAINLLLLSWLALALPLLNSRIGVLEATVLCLAASVVIESLQFVLVSSGRAATLADVVLNVIGAALVALFSVRYVRTRLERWIEPTPQGTAAGSVSGTGFTERVGGR